MFKTFHKHPVKLICAASAKPAGNESHLNYSVSVYKLEIDFFFCIVYAALSNNELWVLWQVNPLLVLKDSLL